MRASGEAGTFGSGGCQWAPMGSNGGGQGSSKAVCRPMHRSWVGGPRRTAVHH